LLHALQRRFADADPLEARVLGGLGETPQEAVERGSVRGDLLYRINGLSLRIPPLRERRDDVVAHARALGATKLTRAAEAALRAYPWPGNDRELELVVERALLVAGASSIDAAELALPAAARPSEPPDDLLQLRERSWRSVEEALIRRVLAEQGGNKSRAAAVLGLHRATLHQKIRAYSIGA
jgi:two-component system response regulator HydG